MPTIIIGGGASGDAGGHIQASSGYVITWQWNSLFDFSIAGARYQEFGIGIDTRHGDVVEWVRFADESELFDVAAIPLTRCPTVVAPDGADMQDATTFEDLPASLTPAAVPVREVTDA